MAVKNLSLGEEYLADHFPGFPVMPGVLMLEAMTQAGAWLVREMEDFAHSVILLKRARTIKYGSFVEPGRQLRLEVEVVAHGERETEFKGKGMIDDQVDGRRPVHPDPLQLAGADPELHRTDAQIVEQLRDLYGTLRKGSVGAKAMLRNGAADAARALGPAEPSERIGRRRRRPGCRHAGRFASSAARRRPMMLQGSGRKGMIMLTPPRRHDPIPPATPRGRTARSGSKPIGQRRIDEPRPSPQTTGPARVEAASNHQPDADRGIRCRLTTRSYQKVQIDPRRRPRASTRTTSPATPPSSATSAPSRSTCSTSSSASSGTSASRSPAASCSPRTSPTPTSPRTAS